MLLSIVITLLDKFFLLLSKFLSFFRLSEANLASISQDIEKMYFTHSKNGMEDNILCYSQMHSAFSLYTCIHAHFVQLFVCIN